MPLMSLATDKTYNSTLQDEAVRGADRRPLVRVSVRRDLRHAETVSPSER